MKKSGQRVKTSKGIITFDEKDYKAAGGQAAVFVKGDMAYKIYHDPKDTIPVAKIHELSAIKHPEVLAPIEPLYDLNDQPIGFSMSSVPKMEYFCKIFTQAFRKAKNISLQEIIALDKKMQKILDYIHGVNGTLVVDYNEMNFLLNTSCDTVYHIDVDSYQTKSFPATALMVSIRDPLTPKAGYNALTDWYSFAIVTFQMYIGTHPFKGVHPDYKPKDLELRMKDGASVFNKKVGLPESCEDFSVIPKKRLEWYKALFSNKDRSEPPSLEAVEVAQIASKVITSKGDFVIRLLAEYDKPVRKYYFLNNERYILTNNEVYKDSQSILKFSKSIDKTPFELTLVENEEPLMAYLTQDKVEFFDLKKTPISSIAAEEMMHHNGIIYTLNNGQLVENIFERLGKLIHRTRIICKIFPSYQMYPGIIVQDDFMKCHLAIPFAKGSCVNIHIPELDGKRIIDAYYNGGFCITISEKGGVYTRTTTHFNTMHSSYTIQEEEIDTLYPINFITLPNGLCISRDNDKVVLFKEVNQRKEISNAPFTASMKLYNEHTQVLFVHDDKLYSVTMK